VPRIRFDEGQIRRRIPEQVHVFADGAAQHLLDVRDHGVEIDDLRPRRLLARKHQQLSGQGRRPLPRTPNFAHVGDEIRPRTHFVEQKVGVAQDDGQHIVEIMGNTARQPAQRLHFLRLIELRGQRLAIRSVPLDAHESEERAIHFAQVVAAEPGSEGLSGFLPLISV